MLRVQKIEKVVIKQHNQFFKNFSSKKGEILPLERIIKKKILSIKISYLSKRKKRNFYKLLKTLKVKYYDQEKLETTISDPSGIEISIDNRNNGYISIYFKNSQSYLRLGQNYDPKSIRPSWLNSSSKPERFCFDIHVDQIMSILWTEK